MPGSLCRAHKHRNDPPPEFVGFPYLADYLGVPCKKLRNTRIFDGLPYRYSETGELLYRRTSALAVIEKHHMTPPDKVHPLCEFTMAEAMLDLGMGPGKFTSDVKLGRLVPHKGKDGFMRLYKRDLDYYRLNYCTRTIVSRMTEPLPRRMVAFMMDVSIKYFRKKLEKKRIERAPHQRRCPIKFTKTGLLAYFDTLPKGPYRRNPFPEYIPAELGAMYCGYGKRKFENLKVVNRLSAEKYVSPTGKKRWGYRKETIDRIVEEDAMREFYGEGCKYYNKKHIKYKFNKSDAWIREFIAGKCSRVNRDGVPLPKTPGVLPAGTGVGWDRAEVEAVVASGVVCHLLGSHKKPRRKRKVNRWVRRKANELAARATPEVVFANPADQVTAAIEAMMAEKEAERKKKLDEMYAKKRAEKARLAAIRGILNTGYEVPTHRFMRRNTRLRLSDDPLKVALILKRRGCKGRYETTKAAEEECVFGAPENQTLNHRLLPPSFARGLVRGMKRVLNLRPKATPSWIIFADTMNMVTDPMFHETLDGIPGHIGAVAPFGYSGFLPDGSWLRNPRTFGGYSLYGTTPGDTRRVYGEVNDGHLHEVGVLAGPFVAFRGEYIPDMLDMDLALFHGLGGIKQIVPEVVSCICVRYGIRMAQVPVESWGPAGYELVDGTPEANLAAAHIREYLDMPVEKLNLLRKGKN